MIIIKKDLSVKQIYNDFTSKIILNDLENDVLIKYIKNESIIKIADDLAISTATVSRIIADLKEKYYKYKQLEIVKLNILEGNN